MVRECDKSLSTITTVMYSAHCVLLLEHVHLSGVFVNCLVTMTTLNAIMYLINL